MNRARSRARHVVDAIAELHARLGLVLFCVVEIGTARHRDWEFGDGHSTIYVAEWAAGKPDVAFHSVDLRVDAANLMLKERGLRGEVLLAERDGVQWLSEFKETGGRIDFLYLDAADDPRLTIKLLEAARPSLLETSVVAVDDCGPGVKGVLLLPMLVELRVPYSMVGRIAFFKAEHLLNTTFGALP